MIEPFFPFTVYSNKEHGYSPSGFKEVFRENRPEYIEVKFSNFTYKSKFVIFCYDVIILSPTEVEFICFDLDNLASDGRCKFIHKFRATVNKKVTSNYINHRLLQRGADRRARELEERELEIYKKYANEEAVTLNLKKEKKIPALNPDQIAMIAKEIAKEFDVDFENLDNSEFMDFIAAAKAAILKYEKIIKQKDN